MLFVRKKLKIKANFPNSCTLKSQALHKIEMLNKTAIMILLVELKNRSTHYFNTNICPVLGTPN